MGDSAESIERVVQYFSKKKNVLLDHREGSSDSVDSIGVRTSVRHLDLAKTLAVDSHSQRHKRPASDGAFYLDFNLSEWTISLEMQVLAVVGIEGC